MSQEKNILTIANQAYEKQDWSLVNHYLQEYLDTNQETDLITEEKQLALQLALKILQESDFAQRWEVGKNIPKLGKIAIAPLIAILEDTQTEPEIKCFVTKILGDFSEPEIILILVKLLRQTDDEEQAKVASIALAKIGSQSIAYLSELMREENCRLLAVQALAHIRTAETINPLLQIIDDPAAEIRSIAIEALSSFQESHITPVLILGLQDKSAQVRKESVLALSRRKDLMGDLDFVAQLKPLLKDINQEVCQLTAIALGRQASEEGQEALWAIFSEKTTPRSLKIEIIKAFHFMETASSLDYLQKALKNCSLEICQEIITILGRKEEPELKQKATEILLAFAQSEEKTKQFPLIKQALAMSLGELGISSALPTLLDLAADADKKVKLHAMAALKKFPDFLTKIEQ